MFRRKSTVRKCWAVLAAGAVFQLGWLGTCNDRLFEATRFADPCGTLLGNCDPGDFQVYNADIGDYCIDPTSTVPGLGDSEGPPLGTMYDLCP